MRRVRKFFVRYAPSFSTRLDCGPSADHHHDSGKRLFDEGVRSCKAESHPPIVTECGTRHKSYAMFLQEP